MSVRRVSLGVRYPPLPRWMGVRREGVGGAGMGRGREIPRWMEKLPGNFGGVRGWRGREGGREGVANGGLVQGGGGGYRGYGRVRGSSDGGC